MFMNAQMYIKCHCMVDLILVATVGCMVISARWMPVQAKPNL